MREEEKTMLTIIVMFLGDATNVRLLIEYKADVNKSFFLGETPLTFFEI